MFRLSVKSDIDRLARQYGELGRRHIPFAVAKALTDTAKDVSVEVRRVMPQFIDRPTPFTLNALFVKRATKTKLSAMVLIKDSARKGTVPVKALSPQIYGGQRNAKRFERALRASGILPNDMVAVPGSAAQLDAFGNMRRAQIMQILSFLGAMKEAMSQKRRAALAKGSEKKGVVGFKYFVVLPGARNLHPGIWKRESGSAGRAIKPVLMFVSRAQYQKRFRFFETSKRVAGAQFGMRFSEAMATALRTAR